MKPIIVAFVSLCAVNLSFQRASPEDVHYVAGVVEYHFDKDTGVNLNNYIDFIHRAAEQNVDIIVFPEMTLTRGTSVKVPIHGLLKEHPIPALNPELYDEVLVQLSKAVRETQMYAVVNVQEEMDCTDAPGELCPAPKVYKFNTNVVFDRNGKVIDRYRKINLFGEYTRQPSLDNQLGVFTTDFGVKFGHFICFDLMFQVPAIQVLQKMNITNVAYSTMWFSEMPYLTATEIQEAYAIGKNINFLAAGANNVKVGSAGSGIYSGQAGALVSIMPGTDTRRLLVSIVPKIPGQVAGMSYPGALPQDPKVKDELLMKKDPSLESQPSKLVEETDEFQDLVVEDGEVKCRFRIKLRRVLGENDNSPQYTVYRGFAFSRTVTYVQRTLGINSCGIVACLTDDIVTCAQSHPNAAFKYGIEELQLTMSTFRPKYNETYQCDDAFYYPISLQTSKYPLAPAEYTYSIDDKDINIYHSAENHGDTLLEHQNGISTSEYCSKGQENEKQTIIMTLLEPQNDLLSFGVWGRNYNKDVNKRGEEVDDETKKIFQEFEDSL